ncbi:MAG TPA: glycosyltransferase, partial [Phycisphaerae bacterium]|nr:glycosyltransferase [Phycisphaerae bacterium]
MAEDTVQSNRQRVLIVIPAYNEAAKIPQVMADLREHAPSTDVVVVDDGSTDDT